jgi:UPF0271 protein
MQEAKAIGLQCIQEAFADRTYQANGQLTPRHMDRAIIEAPTKATQQVLSMIFDQSITALDGTIIEVKADTICIHGDHTAALAIGAHLFNTLQQYQIEIKQP